VLSGKAFVVWVEGIGIAVWAWKTVGQLAVLSIPAGSRNVIAAEYLIL